ncbi:MAG: exodeoxyribonuclease VII small subunit [Bacteroidaceae bacterium]|nr:exodeoxyribonuclease VII small subunit [Bacteroidaceae bacterium]
MKYEEAMKRLEQIVSDIEEGKLDIDLISERLKEAKELITICRDKLYKVDADVKKILEDDQPC